MNDLFQEFLTVALREALNVSPETLRSEREVELDEDGRARLKPDLSWWDDGICTFAGDAKYKNLTDNRSVPGADLYQLLAYATALNLPGGLLIYAQGEADTCPYRVKHTSKRLEVMALDLSGTLDDVLDRVQSVAASVGDLHRWMRQIGHDGRSSCQHPNRWRIRVWHSVSASTSAPATALVRVGLS
jgi:5-methylcytosine-specific restriction enzyme subunit McrC